MMIEPRLEWNLFCTKHNIDPKCIDDRARLWFEWCSEMGSKFCYRKDVFYVYYRKYLPSSKTEIVYSRSSSPETERRQSMVELENHCNSETFFEADFFQTDFFQTDISVKDTSVKDTSVKDISVKDISVKDISVKDISVRDISSPSNSTPFSPAEDHCPPEQNLSCVNLRSCTQLRNRRICLKV